MYHLHLDALIDLRPDVVLTCLQDAHGAILEGQLLDAALRSALGYAPRVVHCSGASLEGTWADMQAIADALGQREGGRRLVDSQRARMAAVADACRGRGRLRVAVFQWPHPLMAAGGWVTEMVQRAGSVDVFGSAESAVAPIVATEQLAAAAPQVVIWAPCGLDLRKSDGAAQAAAARLGGTWAALPAVRAGRVAVVNGEKVFSRPGPLLTESFEVLVEILHPEVQRCHEGALWQAMQASKPSGGGAAGVASSNGGGSSSSQKHLEAAPAFA